MYSSFDFWEVNICLIYFLGVRLLSVLRGHSFFSSKDFPSQILSITFISYLNSWERASISLLMFSAKQGHYWYHFYNVFGMTRSLTGDWSQHSTTRLSRRRCLGFVLDEREDKQWLKKCCSHQSTLMETYIKRQSRLNKTEETWVWWI